MRLEQIPPAIELLRALEAMSETPNLGLELALRYADPTTRFAAACEALAVLNRLSDDKLNNSAASEPPFKLSPGARIST